MRKVIAVDFDGTLCESKYPKIGRPYYKMINLIKLKKKQGYGIILWTCRTDHNLENAVEWCKKQGLVFDAVNENLPERIRIFGNDPRKIGADIYIDDKAFPAWSIPKDI